MLDLTSERLPLLRAGRVDGLDLGDGFVYPNYSGNSIVNVASSVCALLGLPGLGAPALDAALLAPLGGGIKRVVLILMDALALHRLQAWLEDEATVWRRVADGGVLAPLTSICPSTTCAALTSIWSGRTAREHGIMGYEMWLKEYGVVANMILHSPMALKQVGVLEQAGFEPDKYLPWQTLGEHLKAHGVEAHAFQPASIVRSGLSRMFMRETKIHGFHTPSELWVGVRKFLETSTAERLFVWVYWGQVDHFSHVHGPDEEQARAEFGVFSREFERLFFEKLASAARRDTAVILMADHGQVTTPKAERYWLKNHPKLAQRLHILPTGENRLLYLYPQAGGAGAVRRYVESAWGDDFVLCESREVAESGLFGPRAVPMHANLLERIGDFTVFARKQAYLWWGAVENPLIGRHGGLTEQEMVVPFLAGRLD